LSDDDLSDMKLYNAIARDFQTACNVAINRANSLESRLIAINNPNRKGKYVQQGEIFINNPVQGIF